MPQRLLQVFTRVALVVALGLGSLGCATAGKNRSGIRSVSRVYTSQIKDAASFRRYSKLVGGERFTKFIIDLKTQRITYFDVNIYKLHVEFVFNEIYRRPQSARGLMAFNRNYDADKPEFLLGYLVHHQGPDEWTLSFWEGDEATPEQVSLAYRRVQASFYLGTRVKFRPDSTAQENVAERLKGIPTITNNKLYRASNYQNFHAGESLGQLRIVRKGTDPKTLTFKSDQIVILGQALPDITPVRGIITEQFSTPLSHLSLRARAWGIPHAGIKKAATTYAALDGKTVLFKATREGANLRLATDEEIATDKARRAKKRKVKLPKANLAQRALKRLTQLRAKEAGAYGAKAANLGEIASAKLSGFITPAGFAIPIVFYQEHLRRNGLEARIKSLLKDPAFVSDSKVRRERLKALRKEIHDAPLDPALATRIRQALLALPTKGGVFVRSSTNAEDLPGFNGAGLYDTVPNVKSPEKVLAAVRTVWASVWNLRAYEERQHFGIDHLSVYGAILIQLAVPAVAAGVLITGNIFDKTDEDTYTINAKRGLGMKVVQGRKIPEQLLFDTSNMGIKVISRSDEKTLLVFDKTGGIKEVPNPHPGKPVLTDSRVLTLGLAAQRIQRLFPKHQAIDIEWLFGRNHLYIVQSRPYVTR